MGVAHVLHPDDLTPATLRTAVDRALADTTCAHNARLPASDIASMPGPDRAAEIIETLTISAND